MPQVEDLVFAPSTFPCWAAVPSSETFIIWEAEPALRHAPGLGPGAAEAKVPHLGPYRGPTLKGSSRVDSLMCKHVPAKDCDVEWKAQT